MVEGDTTPCIVADGIPADHSGMAVAIGVNTFILVTGDRVVDYGSMCARSKTDSAQINAVA